MDYDIWPHVLPQFTLTSKDNGQYFQINHAPQSEYYRKLDILRNSTIMYCCKSNTYKV